MVEFTNLILPKKERNLISIDDKVIFFHKIYIFHFFRFSILRRVYLRSQYLCALSGESNKGRLFGVYCTIKQSTDVSRKFITVRNGKLLLFVKQIVFFWKKITSKFWKFESVVSSRDEILDKFRPTIYGLENFMILFFKIIGRLAELLLFLPDPDRFSSLVSTAVVWFCRSQNDPRL